MLSWEIIAHGRVQGVGFRSFARRCAEQCNVKGYVKNQSDGTVLIIASGEKAELVTYCDLLRTGQRYVQVDELQVTEIKHAVEYNDFKIR